METKYIRIGTALLISFIQLILVFFFTTAGVMILRIAGFLSIFLSVFLLVMSFIILMLALVGIVWSLILVLYE